MSVKSPKFTANTGDVVWHHLNHTKDRIDIFFGTKPPSWYSKFFIVKETGIFHVAYWSEDMYMLLKDPKSTASTSAPIAKMDIWTDEEYHQWKMAQITCECGVHKVYGKNAPYEYHSDWCPIGKRREEDKQANKLIEEMSKNAKNS